MIQAMRTSLLMTALAKQIKWILHPSRFKLRLDFFQKAVIYFSTKLWALIGDILGPVYTGSHTG